MTSRIFIPLLAATALAIMVAFPGRVLAQSETPCIPNETDGSCLPVAPESERRDLAAPSFSDPTTITNPLFPIGAVPSVLMLGTVDGKPFRTEVTLLDETKTIEWNGQRVETLVSQYAAYLDGRIHEVALDWYAQADDGSVWYFGEDVFNYEDGVVVDTDGTWLAGKDGPAGMIMPANPQVGDVYRPENIPGFVFEEVTVTAIGETVDGPHGPVEGAIVVDELHQDGGHEEKTFAPGYGEFLTGGGGDLEAVALAVPTDALRQPEPAELEALATGAADLFAAVQAQDWSAAPTTLDAMTASWETYRVGDVPAMIDAEVSDAFAVLTAAVAARDPVGTRQAAIDVAQGGLDLQLRYRAPAEIDLGRFDLGARQLLADAAADDPAAVSGDVANLEWIRDRVTGAVDPASTAQLDARLSDLRAAADAGNLPDATDAATQLRGLLAGGTLGTRIHGLKQTNVSAANDDETSVPAGTLDDGEELLPQATLTLVQAVQAAQAAAAGSIGEVDLEHVGEQLVFNVDVGDQDVKVDAATGAVVSVDGDD